MTESLVPSRQSILDRLYGQFIFDPSSPTGGILPAMTVSKWVPTEAQLKAFGARLAAARKAKGLTLDDVGARFGYGSGKGAPWTWENGKVQPPVFLLSELARLYGTSLDYLVTGDQSGAWPFPTVPPEKFFSISPEIREHTERSLASAIQSGEIADREVPVYVRAGRK